jgi:sugar lactone lactonase YvrE
MDIELVLDAHAMIAESPTWVAAENAVYWIDIKAPALHRLDLASGVDKAWEVDSDIGGFALIAGPSEAVVALRRGIHALSLQTGALTLLAPPPFDPNRHRFNEGACDSTGRFWIGTMFDPVPDVRCVPEPGSLYSFTLADGLRPEPDSAELHNGMAWDRGEQVLYLSHSQQHTVFAFPFERTTGSLGQRRDFIKIPPDLGLPDGAAIDEEGCYWCALHGSGRLHRYRSDGAFDRSVMLPVSQPTMCAFAGADLELMIVTSASDQLSPQQKREEPHAGGIFCFRPGVRGISRHHLVR